MAYNVDHLLRVGDAKTIHDNEQAQINDLKSAFNDSFSNGLKVGQEITGKYASVENNVVSIKTGSDRSYTRIECTAGDVFAINGSATSTGLLSGIFADVSGNVLSHTPRCNKNIRQTCIVTAPTNATVLYVNYASNTPRAVFAGDRFDPSVSLYMMGGYYSAYIEMVNFNDTSNNKRCVSRGVLRKDIAVIVADDEYEFNIVLVNADGTIYGGISTSGAITTGAYSSKYFSRIEIDNYAIGKQVLFSVRRKDNADFTESDAAAAIRMYTHDEVRTVEEITEDAQIHFPTTVENKYICLAGIRKNMVNNRFQTCTGFLMHRFKSGEHDLYYGPNIHDVKKIGSVSYDVSQMRFAVSPKDGRVIATKRDTRDGIYVWDGKGEVHLNSFTSNPCGWLYNSGVDFINDGDDEYCVFAEYWGTSLITPMYVWRGKYPYTSASDWEIVLTQTAYNPGATGDGITHFHMIRRDPWTNILYCTSGDDTEKCKWWYSTDAGATWTLLTTGATSGWEDHTCRTINFIFTPDYIYWATDHGTNHTLNRIERDSVTGIIDISTREKLADLPECCATNFLCYSEFPHGLFMYDRIDAGYVTQYGGAPIAMNFWNLDTGELEIPFKIKLRQDTWGGSRGKCYIDYTSGVQPYPAMGFSIDTTCIFDIIAPDRDAIGTIEYDIGAKTVRLPIH